MSFGKMNSFIDIVIMRKTKDPEGFATTAYDVVASARIVKADMAVSGGQTLRHFRRQPTYSASAAFQM